MKVLITGATGLVGSAVARKFLSEGHNVSAIYRKTSDKSLLSDIDAEISWIEGDILDLGSLEDAIKDADCIVHTAAVVSFVPADRNMMYKVNVEGTANVVNVCL